MKRYQIINTLINIYGYETYLEVGVDHPMQCFDKIKIENKIGVDPNGKAMITATSDDFFKSNRKKFDIIFIDGLHHKDQVIRDIDNALKVLNHNGAIVVHDCNPTSDIMQRVPRETGEWTGDVWKAWLHFRANPDLSMHVLETDYGVGIIRRGKQLPFSVESPTYKGLNLHRKNWLNLIPYKLEPVSICIPAFEQYGHGVSTLRQCLDSCFAQHGEYEVIVSDNSHDNGIEKLCKSYNLRYFKNPIRGISHNSNFVMGKAKNKLIKLMYQDDKFVTRNAINDISFALKFNEWVAIYGYGIDRLGKVIKESSPMYPKDVLKGKNTLGMPSVTAWQKNNIEFDHNLKTRLDCDVYYRLFKRYGEPGYIKQRHVASRYWDGSTSAKQGNLTKEEWPYLREKYSL